MSLDERENVLCGTKKFLESAKKNPPQVSREGVFFCFPNDSSLFHNNAARTVDGLCVPKSFCLHSQKWNCLGKSLRTASREVCLTISQRGNKMCMLKKKDTRASVSMNAILWQWTSLLKQFMYRPGFGQFPTRGAKSSFKPSYQYISTSLSNTKKTWQWLLVSVILEACRKETPCVVRLYTFDRISPWTQFSESN